MKQMVYVDRVGKEYQVLQDDSFAYLYEEGYEIFRGSIQQIENLGLVFKAEGSININLREKL